MPGKVLLGCIIGVLSSATQSVGLTLQRKSHIQHEQQQQIKLHTQQVSSAVYKRPLWRLGFSLFLIANLLGSSVQITTLPLIILSPLQAIGLVFNSLCACLLLDEEFSVESILSMVGIGAGALFVAYFGSDESDDKDWKLKELIVLLKRKHFIVWISTSVIIVMVLFAYLKIVKRVRNKGVQIRFYLTHLSIEKYKIVKGCSYGIISGTLSAHSLLFAKISVEIVIRSINDGYENLKDIKSWLIILSFLSLALIQLWFLNQGLKNVSTSILYPLVFCTYNIINITNGLVFYNKLESLTFVRTFMILIGTVMLLIGVFTLSWRLKEEGEAGPCTPKTGNIIDFKHNHRASNAEAGYLLNYDRFDDYEEDTGYVSFASPSKLGDNPALTASPRSVLANNTHQSDDDLVTSTPFKYGSILDDGRHGIGKALASVPRGKRVMSFEQNELLQQLQNEPDV